MADVELLPLPLTLRHPSDKDLADHVQTYARACVEANLAPLQAENERLRAEVEDFRTNGAAAVKFAPGSAYWSDELNRLFGGDARTGIGVLESRYQQERTRAERLAEALREATAMLLADYPETAKRLRDALAQEDRNG